MRILIVTNTYSPSLNGIAISLSLQKRELEKRGHKITLIAPSHNNQKPEKGVVRVPSVQNKKYPDYPFLLPIPRLSDLKKLSKTYDLVYFHHPFYIGDVALNLAKYYHCPSVFFYHTQYEQYATAFTPKFIPSRLVRRLIAQSVNKTMNKSNHIMVETESVRNSFRRQKIETPISVIPTSRNSMKLNLSKDKLRKKFGIDSKLPVVLCVARLSKEKNLNTLMDASAKIISNNPFTLCFAGDGPEAESLRGLAKKLKIQEYCHFLGSVDFRTMPEVYSMSDIFAYPSKSDTQAIVVLEAMSAGLPVVGFNASGPKDFISRGRNGFLAGSNSEFLSHLYYLVENESQRKIMSDNALEYSKNYSLKKTTDDTEKLFMHLSGLT